MKNLLSRLMATAFLVAICTMGYAQISTSALDSRLIHPFGTAFNPMAKFTGIGESGGTPGATVDGCDLYGFRAQFDLELAISMGIQSYTVPGVGPVNLPIILVAENRPLGIVEKGAPGSPVGDDFGCGTLLAVFKQSAGTNNVMTIFGSATAIGGSFSPSDRTLKRDIQPIANALDIVSQLNGYTYEYRRNERPDLNLPEGRRYGFITQEVQEVMPTAVRQGENALGDPDTYQVMEYNAITPVLAEAIKMQQDIIADLEADNKELEARLARLEALVLKNGASSSASDINSSDIVLAQNRPNPTKDLTTIDYSLPLSMDRAELVVFDINGQMINRQAVAAGEGSIDLNTSRWTSGTYVYAIVLDGKTLARQQLVVQ